MHNFKNYILLLLVVLVFGSCNKKDLEAEVPSYVQINPFTFTTNESTQGTDSHNLTDGWVYINGELQGVFELPVKFPVLGEGNVTIEVEPGIKENGISERRVRYFLCEGYSEQIELKKEQLVVVNPTSTYRSSTTFYWMEDFESASLPFTYPAASDTTMHKYNIGQFEGDYSARAKMNSSQDFFEAISQGFTGLPKIGKDVFLEMNFKTNQPVLVGLYADAEQIGLFFLNDSEGEWKKIYLNFSEAIQTRPSTGEFKIFFGFQSEVSNPELMIDNLKLVHN